MNKRIVYTTTDGQLHVVIPAPECSMSIEEIAKKDVPTGLAYEIIDSTDLPKDRTFRDAWHQPSGKKQIEVHMPRARAIHMDRLRALRSKKFIEMGVPWKLHPGLEKSTLPADVQATLQALRDIPQTIDLSKAKTPDELKAMIPKILNESKESR